MPKLTKIVPSYRLHKQSGQAIVTLSGRDFLLGPHGTRVSKSKYNRLVAEWLNNDQRPFARNQDGLTIGELVCRYYGFARGYYTKLGLPTAEVNCIKAAMRPLCKLYDDELVT